MKKNKSTDAHLVSAYMKGDELAISELITRHKQKIYSFIYSKVFDKDVSEDIFQDTFIKVINTLKRGAYNEEGKFIPWVMRISHNLVIDYFRKNNRMPKFEDNGEFSIFSIISDGNLNAEKRLIKDQVEEDLRNLIQEATVRSGLKHIIFPSSFSKVNIDLLKFSPDLCMIYSESNSTSGSDKTKPLLLKVLIICSDNFFDFIH